MGFYSLRQIPAAATAALSIRKVDKMQIAFNSKDLLVSLLHLECISDSCHVKHLLEILPWPNKRKLMLTFAVDLQNK